MKSVLFFSALFIYVAGLLHADNTGSFLPPAPFPSKLNYRLNCFEIEESQKDKNLVLVSKNYLGCENCIEKISLFFDLFETPDFDAARLLITQLVSGFINNINGQEELSCYFAAFPLTSKQVDVRVRIRRTQCGFFFPPLGNIAYITAVDGEVIYHTLNSFTFHYDVLRRESFDTALKWANFANPNR
jgi:hypothetical protein